MPEVARPISLRLAPRHIEALKLTSTYWKNKIARNRERDALNQGLLEQAGWRVIRIWEHEVEADPVACANRIEQAVRSATVRQAALARLGALLPPSKPPQGPPGPSAKPQRLESRRKL